MNIEDIVVKDRQRQNIGELDEHFIASVKKRLIHPIVLRLENDQPTLVVGGRRLAALKASGLLELEHGKHFVFMNDLDEYRAQIVELEENIKRQDLFWHDHVKAVGRIHDLYMENNITWSKADTAQEINISRRQLDAILFVNKNLDSKLLENATSIKQAYSILQLAAERKTVAIISEISESTRNLFLEEPLNGNPKTETPSSLEMETSENPSSDPNNNSHDSSKHVSLPSSPSTSVVYPAQNPSPCIICANFLEWVKTYEGPKFTVIHCDFPYDIDYSKYAHSVTSSNEDYDFKGFFELLDTLLLNLDRIASYQSHLMFWFSMKFYQEIKNKLEAGGLSVHEHPLIWFKSDNSGIIPSTDGRFPRRVYETAFLCSRGKRPLIKPLANLYPAPIPSKPLHPSQKSEPMLRHFFSMLIDETTDFLDPTCGSGSGIRVAESLGARSVLGLEIDPNYADLALKQTQNAIALRKAAKQ